MLCECDYVDKNRYIHQLTKIERTKQTNKTLRKGPLKIVNINCYVLQAEMFASLCLPTKHIFPIGYVPRVKRRTKITNHIALELQEIHVPVAPSRKQFYLFTFFRCHIKAKINYFINRFILESESITITRLNYYSATFRPVSIYTDKICSKPQDIKILAVNCARQQFTLPRHCKQGSLCEP